MNDRQLGYKLVGTIFKIAFFKISMTIFLQRVAKRLAEK